MKTQTYLVLGLIVFLCAAPAPGQSFEGTITYSMDIAVKGMFKSMGITKEMLMERMKNEPEWFDEVTIHYLQNNYAFVANNKTGLIKVYNPKDNKIYTFHLKGDNICSVQDAVDLTLEGTPDKPEVSELDSAVTIMGVPCKILRMKWALGQVDYYYNASMASIDPELYKTHTSEGWYEYLKRSGSLPLQVVRGAMGMDIVQTATSVKAGQVNRDVFKLPVLVEDDSLNVIPMPGTSFMRIKK